MTRDPVETRISPGPHHPGAPTVDQYERPAGVANAAWALHAFGIAQQLAERMAEHHLRGHVHGNLGPSTVVLEPDGALGPRVHIVAAPERLYPAPELAGGKSPTTHSDVYGFGCVLATLLLSVPEPGWDQILHPNPGTDVAEELRRLATEAMNPRPAARPYSFLVVLERLQTIRDAWAADQALPGAGAELLDAPTVPDELAAILGWISAHTPPRLLRWAPGWPRLVARLGLPVPGRGGVSGRGGGRGRGAGRAGGRMPRPGHPGQSAYPGQPGQPVRAERPAPLARRRPAPRGLVPGVLAAAAAVLALAVGILWAAGADREPVAQAQPGRSAAATPPAGQSPDAASPGPGADVSLDAGTATVPALAGAGLDDARQALDAAGLTLGAVSRRDGPQPAGRVLATTPGGGALAAPGSPVDLTVASGSNAVPDRLVGHGVDAASAALQAAGFPVETTIVDTAKYVTGYVLQASPDSGSTQPVGTRVTLTVAHYVPAPPQRTPAATPPAPSSSPSAPADAPSPAQASAPSPDRSAPDGRTAPDGQLAPDSQTTPDDRPARRTSSGGPSPGG
ncbi:MAG TPA: PASTA domain-containing protein [Gryllotalpicola sp.]